MFRSRQEATLALAFHRPQRKKKSKTIIRVTTWMTVEKHTSPLLLPLPLTPSPPNLKIMMMMRRPIIFNAKCCGHSCSFSLSFCCAATETHQNLYNIHPPHTQTHTNQVKLERISTSSLEASACRRDDGADCEAGYGRCN